MIKTTLFLYCFCIIFVHAAYANETRCEPTRYADGDTFTAWMDNKAQAPVRVRVAGYDAPERGQPYSRRAQQRLRELTQAGALCDCYKTDRYGRTVCTVRTLSGQNVAPLMLRDGLGCIDPRFEGEARAEDRQAARQALEAAQRARRGMWADDEPVCAQEHRRAQRAQR